MNELIIGKKYTIHSYKHNGNIHRSWDEAILLDICDDYLVFGNNKTKVTEAELEEQKEEVADFTELEDAIEYWTKIVELDEQYVELCQADADAKKAALEAATATPAE